MQARPITKRVLPNRLALALGWIGFLFFWLLATTSALGLVGATACGGDGGTPYYEPSSPRGSYCEGVDDYFGWGEPGALAVLPYAAPIVLALAVGAYGVRHESRRLLVAAGAVFLGLTVFHLVVPFALPG